MILVDIGRGSLKHRYEIIGRVGIISDASSIIPEIVNCLARALQEMQSFIQVLRESGLARFIEKQANSLLKNDSKFAVAVTLLGYNHGE